MTTCSPIVCAAVCTALPRLGVWTRSDSPARQSSSLSARPGAAAPVACPQFGAEKEHAGDVAARPIEAGHETELHRVDAGHEHDRQRRGRCLRRQRGSVVPTNTATGRWIKSAASAGNRSCDFRERISMATFWPSTKPFSSGLAGTRQPGARTGAATSLRRNPITGIAGFCARAASGHAAAPPSSVMNSRRFNRPNCIPLPLAKMTSITGLTRSS